MSKAIDRSGETSLENQPLDFQHGHDGDLDRSGLGDKMTTGGCRESGTRASGVANSFA